MLRFATDFCRQLYPRNDPSICANGSSANKSNRHAFFAFLGVLAGPRRGNDRDKFEVEELSLEQVTKVLPEFQVCTFPAGFDYSKIS